MNTSDTVVLIPYSDLLEFMESVRRMRDSQKQYMRLRGEQPHLNLEPLYRIVRSHEADVDRRVRETTATACKAITSLFSRQEVSFDRS